jgi:uncharacterized protein YkwD
VNGRYGLSPAAAVPISATNRAVGVRQGLHVTNIERRYPHHQRHLQVLTPAAELHRRLWLSGFAAVASLLFLFVGQSRSVAAATAPSAATARNAAPVNVGDTCPTAARAVDTTGKRVVCLNSSVGKFWAWSDPIGVPAAEVVPGSWSNITADVAGLNAVPATEPITAVYPDRAAMASRLIEIVNGWRASKGVAPLTADNRLAHLGKFWAERIGTGQYTGGTGSHCPRTLCAARMMELGYLGVGEVIRPWTPIPTGDLTAERYFIDSPVHFAILTDPRYTHVGFAFHVVAGSDGRPQSMVVVGEVGRSR